MTYLNYTPRGPVVEPSVKAVSVDHQVICVETWELAPLARWLFPPL